MFNTTADGKAVVKHIEAVEYFHFFRDLDFGHMETVPMPRQPHNAAETLQEAAGMAAKLQNLAPVPSTMYQSFGPRTHVFPKYQLVMAIPHLPRPAQRSRQSARPSTRHPNKAPAEFL